MKKVILICLLFWGAANHTYAQSSSATNAWLNGRYLGYDGSNANNPLFFRTNNVLRMSLNGNITNAINGQPAAARNGDGFSR